jgi:hypothetical protein
MKNATFDSVMDVVEEMGRALTRAMRMSFRALATMSWPTLFVVCILLAMAISIVPLVLVLFLIFSGIKLILASFVLEKRKGRATPYRDVEPEAPAEAKSEAAADDKTEGKGE